MNQGRLEALLRLVYSPTAGRDEKLAAEAELQAFGRTGPALEWAVGVLNQAPNDMQALHFACTAVDSAVLYGWQRLDAAQHSVLRDCLWRCTTEPGRPHFVRAKLAGSLAHVACLEWPQAWPALQACLTDPPRMAAGVDLLAATLEHFHSLAQTTSFGLKGKVPSASIQAIKQHYKELQPVALVALCSLLQTLHGSISDTAALQLAARALRALRHALADASKLPTEQGVTAGAIISLLFGFVAAAAPSGPAASSGDSDAEEAALELAACALDCAADLQTKYLSTQEQQQMLEALLPRLQDTCALVKQRWARQQQQGQGGAVGEADPLLTAFVRLFIQVFSTQLSAVEVSPALAPALHGMLGQLLALSTARRSPVDLLLFLEVWHALLTHLDNFEAELWEAEDDPQAQERIKQAAAAYKGPILAIADAVLATLRPAGAASAPPPFTLDSLSSAPGSGSAMEDWLESVVTGGDAGNRERGQEESSGSGQAAGDDDDEEEEGGGMLLVPGAAQGGSSPFQLESEVDVYVRHAESFLGRAISSFSADRLPWVLLTFQASSQDFAAGCQEVMAAAAAAGGGFAAVSAALLRQLPACRGMDVCLRLLTRCGPSFPTRGAAEPPAQLTAGSDGDQGRASGAHVVHSMRALCQLAALWLQSVQAVAAATQPAGGQPATPAHIASSAAGGSAAALSAMLLAGSRLYKALGSLTATWLSQLVLGLVQGSADPDAAAVAQELLHAVLSTSAALLQAVASPQLAGWSAALHRAAVWAAEALVSLSSIALSSSFKPPPALLQAVWGCEQVQGPLRQAAQASLATPALLPLRASRALWLSLSDLSLRCWPAQPAPQFDSAARGAAFAGLAAPLVQLLQQAASLAAAHGSGSGGGLSAGVATAVRQAGTIAACIVQSYSGSPKALRSIVSSNLVAPALPSIVSLLHSSSSGSSGSSQPQQKQGSKASAALLRLVSASLEVLATELGSEAVEQLLGALVQVFSASGGDPSFESDLLMMQLVLSILSQGGTQRHQSLVRPAALYCLGVWERTASAQAVTATDADLQHVRAATLASLLALLRYRWRTFAPGAKPAAQLAGAAAADAPSTGAHPLAAGLHAAATAAASAQQQGGAAEASDPAAGEAAIQRVLQLLLGFFEAAAALQVVLPAADVRLVLEELFELQVATKLNSLPAFQPVRAPLAAALLALLCSRLYGAAQEALADTLFSLAAANWSEFHLSTLPAFIEARLAPAGMGPGERGALLALFGGADLDAHSFERRLLAFLNDAAYYERAAAYAGV